MTKHLLAGVAAVVLISGVASARTSLPRRRRRCLSLRRLVFHSDSFHHGLGASFIGIPVHNDDSHHADHDHTTTVTKGVDAMATRSLKKDTCPRRSRRR